MGQRLNKILTIHAAMLVAVSAYAVVDAEALAERERIQKESSAVVLGAEIIHALKEGKEQSLDFQNGVTMKFRLTLDRPLKDATDFVALRQSPLTSKIPGLDKLQFRLHPEKLSFTLDKKGSYLLKSNEAVFYRKDGTQSVECHAYMEAKVADKYIEKSRGESKDVKVEFDGVNTKSLELDPTISMASNLSMPDRYRSSQEPVVFNTTIAIKNSSVINHVNCLSNYPLKKKEILEIFDARHNRLSDFLKLPHQAIEHKGTLEEEFSDGLPAKARGDYYRGHT
jgi:hypothetical protein